MTPNNEISALLNLIEDPDEVIFTQVKDKLISFGPDIVPNLEKAWDENRFGKEYLIKIENIIHEIQFNEVSEGLKLWINNRGNDLLEGVLLVNQYQYPEFDRSIIYKQLNNLTQDIRISIEKVSSGIEKIFAFNEIFYKLYGFSGNRKNYYAPENSYLSDALQQKRGNALMLSIIYLEVAKRLQLPLRGVNLPSHFIIGYLDISNINKTFNDHNNFLFFINTFSTGEILQKEDLDNFLNKLGIENSSKYYHYVPSSNIDMVKRLLVNLRFSYHEKQLQIKETEVALLLELFQ